ncbi:hypothetical protein [Maribacter sp. 4G9]|uniref:hypothetical protein n=1 Tax=Maribacter sp. 4G9 TaxID=1889777 RepID=UPI000C1617DB|nr:hypothetical protein [Maribacter sp. 4G9]PIB29172.1 hypothetical protein BFP75_03925 [Maribacter sp. 4G9]
MNEKRKGIGKIASREDLISFFSKGKLPNEDHFEQLINSNYNKADDNLDIDDKDGLMLYPAEDGKLLNFFEGSDDEDPRYGIQISKEGLSIVGKKENKVSSKSEEEKPHIFIEKDKGKIGIGNNIPKHKLDVSGFVASQGRLGNIQGEMPADGQWHNVFGQNNLYNEKEKVLTNVNAFEIMAYARGEVNKGRYSLLHAICTCTWGRSKISKTTSYYGRKRNKIDVRCVARKSQIEDGLAEEEKGDKQKEEDKRGIRKIKKFFGYFWEKKGLNYNLQIRTKSYYGYSGSKVDDMKLFYNISVLWNPNFKSRVLKEFNMDKDKSTKAVTEETNIIDKEEIKSKINALKHKVENLKNDKEKLSEALNQHYKESEQEIEEIRKQFELILKQIPMDDSSRKNSDKNE